VQVGDDECGHGRTTEMSGSAEMARA
jgi:hypothetical protein